MTTSTMMIVIPITVNTASDIENGNNKTYAAVTSASTAAAATTTAVVGAVAAAAAAADNEIDNRERGEKWRNRLRMRGENRKR